MHAQLAGEKIAGLDGHPSQKIAKIEETNRHTIKDILEEGLEHELYALNLYKKLLSSGAKLTCHDPMVKFWQEANLEIDNKLKVIQTDLKANIKKKEKLPSEIDQNKPCESAVNSDPSQKVNKPRRSYLLSQIYSKYDQFYDKRK